MIAYNDLVLPQLVQLGERALRWDAVLRERQHAGQGQAAVPAPAGGEPAYPAPQNRAEIELRPVCRVARVEVGHSA